MIAAHCLDCSNRTHFKPTDTLPMLCCPSCGGRRWRIAQAVKPVGYIIPATAGPKGRQVWYCKYTDVGQIPELLRLKDREQC